MSTEHQELASLRERINELEQRLGVADEASDDSKARSTRRQLLTGGAVAVGAGVASIAMQATPAAAANGDAVTVGQVKSGTSPTEVRTTGGTTLSHNIFTAQDTSYATTTRPAAVAGFAGGDQVSNGVYGYTESLGPSTSHGYALIGNASGRGSSSRAQLLLRPSGGAPTFDSIAHQRGEIVVDGSGRLWFCRGSGTPGTWTELSAHDGRLDGHDTRLTQAESDIATNTTNIATNTTNISTNTADIAAITQGPELLAIAQRAFDSRASVTTGNGGTKGTFSGGENRVVDLTVDTDFAAGSSAALVNVTVVSTGSDSGFVSLYSNATGNLTPPKFSHINWFGKNQILANTTLVPVAGNGKIKIYSSGPTEVLVDVLAQYA